MRHPIKVFTFWSGLLLAILFLRAPAQAAPPSGAGWNLAWNDEFNGTSMDTTKWRHWLLGARRDAVNSPSAVSVDNGSLIISTYTSGGTHYTGMISTQDTYAYTYGYVEARINFDSNPGMWSAFWMQSPTMGNPIGSPNTAGTEIDICEHRKVDGSGVNRDGNIGGVIHWDGYGADHKSHGYDSGNLGLGNGYHLYGMEWTPTQQKFYIDGVLRWTINNATTSPVSQRSEFIILSSEVEDGGWSSAVPVGGYGTLATTTTKMEVDYVRVYRRAETVVNGDFGGKIGPFSTVNQAVWSSTGGNVSPAAARIAPTSGGSSVEQTVRGLLPETSYFLTAWGNAGTTSPNLFIGVKNHGASQTGQTLTSNTYTKATVPFTTGATNRTAAVFGYSSSIGSTAYVDDFLVRRAATVNNGQLESGDSLAWNSVYGGAVVSNDGNNYGGAFAWKIPASGSSAGIEQEVLRLTPATAYRLTGWTTNGNAGLAFGVKNHGGSQVTSTVSANTWTRGTVNFTTGASATSATVFAFRGSSPQTSYIDSFFLSQPLAAPWTSTDVGAPPLSGTSGVIGDSFVIQASGANISSTADKMHFIYQPVTGDVTITARVLDVDTTAYYAKAGLMIRESSADTARSASITWGPVNQMADFSTRTTSGGTAASATTPRDITVAPWLRLTRRGNVFTAYSSPDGASWSRVGNSQTINMAASALIGIPVCSGDNERLTEAALDHVTITQAVPDVRITSPVEGVTFSNNGQSLALTATITGSGTPTITWSKVSGPGNVDFSTPTLATTAATFSAAGTYILRCAATTAAGTGGDDITVNVAPASTADPTLVLRLRLDETSGSTATDSSGGNNHGSTTGSPTWEPASGVLAGAAAFNGTDSYISVPDSPSLDNTNAFTLSYWFNAKSFNGAGIVAKRVSFNDNNAYGTFLTADGKLNIDINSNNDRFTSNASFERGAWYHVALVFDGTLTASQRAKLYINGTLDKTATETSTTIPHYNSPFYVGTISAITTTLFDGLIDDVRFHRRALSAAEVMSIRNETGSHAPTVATGPATAAIVNTTAALTGSVTVDTGPAAVTLWSKTGGPGNVVFSNPASSATNVTFDQTGDYILRLTATNAFGQTFAELADTAFAAAPPLPVVTITRPSGPVYLADAGHALRLTANAATGGVPGTPAFLWTRVSGPGTVTFANAASADTIATFSSPGNQLLRCTVTNSAGSATADVWVTVAVPATTSFRQGANSYSHAATFIRADSPSWNSGARDQFLVGKSTGGLAFRSLFSFPLTDLPANTSVTGVSLDLRTHDSQAGVGNVGALELRTLNATPTEGSGNSGTDAANGAGTGATWINRTASLAWTTQGGDFSNAVLSSTNGFNATTLNATRTFPTSASFVAAVQTAISSGQPLDLMLHSPATESGSNNNFTRLSSDDHSTEDSRPRLNVSWAASPAPVVNTGAAPMAIAGEPVNLTGSVTGAVTSAWSLVSGPDSVDFGNPAQPATTAKFGQPGIHTIRLTSSNSAAEISKDLTIDVAPNPAYFADWQSITWPGVTDPEIIGPDKDPDHDGVSNLMEWALSLNATQPDTMPTHLSWTGTAWEFTYTRRKTAPGEAEFQIEWSDTLAADWSSAGISAETMVSEAADSLTVKATIPSGGGKRFVRLKVSRP